MNIKLLALAFLAYSSAAIAYGQDVAAKARESIASALKAQVAFNGGPLTADNIPRGERATHEIRLKRAQEEWSRFLREKTKDATGSGREGHRAFDELGFWRVFTDSANSDDLMRAIESRAAPVRRLGHALTAAKGAAEMENDDASRSRIISLIEQAQKEVDRWRDKPQEAASARNALRGILPQFLAEAAK